MIRSANIRGGFFRCGGGSCLVWQGRVLPGDVDVKLVIECCTCVGSDVGVEDLGLAGGEENIEPVKDRLGT